MMVIEDGTSGLTAALHAAREGVDTRSLRGAPFVGEWATAALMIRQYLEKR